jgi:oligoendopeptidase F
MRGRNPPRAAVKVGDTWDLSKLYALDTDWDRDLAVLQKRLNGYRRFAGTLHTGPQAIYDCLKFDTRIDRLAERLGAYAYLRLSEDQSNPQYQGMVARYQAVITRASEAASFLRPEILAIPAKKLSTFLKHKKLKPYILLLERWIRFRPHTLSEKEEKLLAMQGEMAGTAAKAFRQLLDSDLKFGQITDPSGQEIELTSASFMTCLQSPDRNFRKRAFEQYYAEFNKHENTLAATLAGSVHKDVYYARARGYDSALDAALFPDQVPTTVYQQLITTVRSRLPALYQYLELRRAKMKLRDLHHYDTYVPILTEQSRKRTWNQAVETVLQSLRPMGTSYVDTLANGLQGRWCDRYPNKGKQSGAFSYGTYDGEPYILMNYRADLLEDVFTLAHEAGHSMHSYYSAKHQSYEYYHYSIFVAEVASTFNEQLLANYLLEHARDDQDRAYLINREIDSIRATIIRQTMFAEFEQVIHAMGEDGEPLTTASIRGAYRNLLEAYFGSKFIIDDILSLESLRIPHFYRSFYVYKYATGLAAAIALSQDVLQNKADSLSRYLRFLESGCSKDPLELLRDAGVDMKSSVPVNIALDRFESLVAELEELLR